MFLFQDVTAINKISTLNAKMCLNVSGHPEYILKVMFQSGGSGSHLLLGSLRSRGCRRLEASQGPHLQKGHAKWTGSVA
jgi:hypothetical protein